MNKRFSNDNMIKSRSIEPSDISRTLKLDRSCDFMEEKYNNPRLTQKENCNRLQFTDRTIRRYRDDIKMDSPYRININKKKKPEQLPDTKTAPNKRSKNSVIKGGDISDTHTISGRELIDQAFQNDRTNAILENKPEDNKKLITIARRMIENK